MAAPDLASSPAVWGFLGATFYAGQQLTTALWGGEGEPSARAKKRAWARFALAEFFGPVAAAAATGPVMHLVGDRATVPATALAIGLSCNLLWPMFVDGIGAEFRRALGAMLKRWGAALSKGDGA